MLFVLVASLVTIGIGSGEARSQSRSTPPAALTGGTSGERSHRIVGYFTAWGPRTGGRRISGLPAERLTHVNYAFANISESGEVVLGDPCADVGWCDPESTTAGQPGGNFAELLALKRRYPHLRTLIAIGGWAWSARFSDAALTPASRQRFAASAIDLFLRRWPGLFDGIDIDWEFPVGGGRPENVTRPEDRENFTLLLAEFRRQLDELEAREGRRYLLTFAAPASPGMATNLELGLLARYVDWINLMTYDFHTGGSIAHFNAPLYAGASDPTPCLTVHATVRTYLQAGVPRGKLVVGVPFYGYGYGGVADVNHGLYQPASGAPTGTWGVGSIDYRVLMSGEPERRGFQRHWHAEAKVPWLYNPTSRVWISYDDPESIGLKAEYVREHRLGGVMIWELGGDDGTLLPIIHDRLRRAKPRRER